MFRIHKYNGRGIVGQDFLSGGRLLEVSGGASFFVGNGLGWDGFWFVLLNARMHGWSTPPATPRKRKCGGGREERGSGSETGWRETGLASPPVPGPHDPARHPGS